MPTDGQLALLWQSLYTHPDTAHGITDQMQGYPCPLDDYPCAVGYQGSAESQCASPSPLSFLVAGFLPSLLEPAPKGGVTQLSLWAIERTA